MLHIVKHSRGTGIAHTPKTSCSKVGEKSIGIHSKIRDLVTTKHKLYLSTNPALPKTIDKSFLKKGKLRLCH
jgi:hypothetical protein